MIRNDCNNFSVEVYPEKWDSTYDIMCYTQCSKPSIFQEKPPSTEILIQSFLKPRNVSNVYQTESTIKGLTNRFSTILIAGNDDFKWT